jgi:CreA protein
VGTVPGYRNRDHLEVKAIPNWSWERLAFPTDAWPIGAVPVTSQLSGIRHCHIRERAVRIAVLIIALLVASTISGQSQTRIDAISTTFRWIGPNDKIVIERYDDPKVANVSCYMSRADTGGIKGGLGFAEDPSRFSIACRAVGAVAIPPGLRKSEVIGFSSASLFFKRFRIHRAVDEEKNVLVYTVVSTKLINGSPFNSISVVSTER